MAIITLTKINLASTPSGNQIFSIKWRQKKDPDVSGSYTAAPDATVDINGNIISPSPYSITTPDTTIVVKAINQCGGTGSEAEFLVCEFIVGLNGEVFGSCPEGYTLSEDGSYCIFAENAGATDFASPQTIVTPIGDVSYGQRGAIIYAHGKYHYDGTGVQLNTITTPGMWMNGTAPDNANADANTTDGRVNAIAAKFNIEPSATELCGISKTITWGAQSYVFIGVTAAQRFQLRVNGIILVDSNDPINYKYLRIYPVMFMSGINIVEVLTPDNSSVSQTMFGMEIYNNSSFELLSATSPASLNILFSTSTLNGTPAHLGTVNHNFKCADGYALNTVGGPGAYICRKITLTSPI